MNESTRRISMAALAAGVVLILVWYFALFHPQATHLKTAQREYTTAQEQKIALEAQVRSLEAIEKQVPADTARLASLNANVPKTPDLKDVLDQLHALATSTGVQLTTVSPSSTNTASSSTNSRSSAVQSITIGMSLSGSYPQMTAFLSGLTKMPRTVVIDSAAIGSGTGLTAQLSTQIFYLSS